MRAEAKYARFLSKIDPKKNGCHIWTGRIGTRGYGKFCGIGAHRWILGYLRGRPLTSSEFALHTCDTPACVNPDHLYVGDHRQNMRDMVTRGRGFNPLATINAAKTHCPRGHEYTPENIRFNSRGSRDCRACWPVRAQERRLAAREKESAHA